jgi:hypothetical protein
MKNEIFVHNIEAVKYLQWLSIDRRRAFVLGIHIVNSHNANETKFRRIPVVKQQRRECRVRSKQQKL